MIKKLEVYFGEEYSESVRLGPDDFDLTRAQFEYFRELGDIPGFILFPNDSSEVWIKQTRYASDEEVQHVIDDIREGFELLCRKAKEIKAQLSIVPMTVIFHRRKAVKVETIKE